LRIPWAVECGKMWVQGVVDKNVLTDGRHLTAAERIFVVATDEKVNKFQRNAHSRLTSLPGNNHSRPHGCVGLLHGLWRLRPRPSPAGNIHAHLFCAPKP